MSNQILYYIMGIIGGLFALIVIAYLVIRSKTNKGDMKKIRQLREGTKQNKFSSDVIYQKLYNFYTSVPVFKRYVLKIRRKLEIIHMQDEYKTRRQASKIITQALCIIIPVTIAVIVFAKSDPLLLVILLLFELFLIETIMSGMIDKYDTKLLKQQIDFFAEIRHAYHEFNMVEEAIYEVSQNDELEVSVQGQRIYEILISDDPETELEKYYDVAPNSFLKEFAGISYLTREFGDRTDKDGASLYLKNLNNITEEMQLEILKRDKLDYVFQSLSVIAILPVLCMAPLKNWAISNFSFTAQFYQGKGGLMVQIALVVLTFVCYYLTRKIKDTGSIKVDFKDQNKVWQIKLYQKPIVKKIMDLLIPKKNTKEHRVITKLMKEASTKQKIETLYVNKVVICLVTMVLTIALFALGHRIALNYVYTEPTSDYNLLGSLNERDTAEALKVTEAQNVALKEFKGKLKTTQEEVEAFLPKVDYYRNKSDGDIKVAAEQVMNKLKIVNGESFQWFELLIAFIFGYLGYCTPTWMLMFQKKLRALEMENEVMEYQTIILMLMKIERVNVEMILEWIERYSNIFREPISKCVNNYESGAWEALETLKDEIAFPQLIRIVESLQAAVEKIPIREAFDELDNERDYYQAKREESNERLIKKKGMIGKIIGFAPMVGLFVGYLIIPLVAIGMTAMTSSFTSIQGIGL
jgi:hypothetical protein